MGAQPTNHGKSEPIAYLCSSYPAVSHTFVLREVQALRRLGVDVQTYSVRRPRQENLLASADREEAARTVNLLPTSFLAFAGAFFRLSRSRRGLKALATASRVAWSMRRAGLRGTLWQAFYLLEAVLLWSSCTRLSIRHIHAHFANVSSDVAMLTSALGSAQDPDAAWSWSFTMHGPAEFWESRQAKLAEKVRSAQFVACISHFASSQLMALTDPDVWDRLHIVHCGLDLASYSAATDRPVAPGPHKLITVGRLVPAKGQLLFVEMVRRLRDRGLDVSGQIIGEGPTRPALEERIAGLGLGDEVTLLGAVGHDRVPDYVAAATVFVLPSFAEGVPVVLMEAMALRVPVVATHIAGIPELIEDGVSGLLVTPSEVDELTAATERLLLDESFRSTIAAAGREQIESSFDVDQEARKLARLFRHRSQVASLPRIQNDPI
jgi:colanic acid/amylovoran biosynthesis glycosyltransferase